jgi:hypothetical protein
MKVEIELVSPAAPLQLTVRFTGVEYFYRERHWRWRVERNNVEIDAGTTNEGDFISEGLARIFHAAASIEQLLFQEYATNLEDTMKRLGY